MKNSTSVLMRWAMVLAYAGLIFVISSRPIPPEYVPRVRHFDKLLHVIAYGLLAMMCFRALWPNVEQPMPFWVLALGAVMTTVYGALEEFHQSFVPARECSLWDMAANGVGAALAAALWEPLTHRYHWLK